jgi:hypothetical protein
VIDRNDASRRGDAPDQPRTRTATPPELLAFDAGTSAEPPPFVVLPVLIVGDSVEVVDDCVPDVGSVDVTGSVVTGSVVTGSVVTDVGSVDVGAVVEGSVTGTVVVGLVVTGVVVVGSVVTGVVVVDPVVVVAGVVLVVCVWLGKPVGGAWKVASAEPFACARREPVTRRNAGDVGALAVVVAAAVLPAGVASASVSV